MAHISEQHIVRLLKNGDNEAIAIIYENYASALFGIILKITINESLAEDALQESIIKIWKYAHRYDSKKAKLFTWMYRIARNTAIDKLRSHNLKHHKEVQITNSNRFKKTLGKFRFKISDSHQCLIFWRYDTTRSKRRAQYPSRHN